MTYVVIQIRDRIVLERTEFTNARVAENRFHILSKMVGIGSKSPPRGLAQGRNLMNAVGYDCIIAVGLPTV